MTSVKEAFLYAKEKLKKSTHPTRDAEDLLSHILQVKPLEIYTFFSKTLTSAEIDILKSYVKRRQEREPIEYILRTRTFLDCDLTITPDVLIPRQETELLAAHLIDCIQDENKILWDVCTGSGCLGIALKKHLPSLKVTLSDISKKALSVARLNAKKNRVQVDLKWGDLLQPFCGETFDYLICNPPYVAKQDPLPKDVLCFEPHLALFGGDDGLDFYRKLKTKIPKYAKRGSKIFFEIGTTQGNALLKLFPGGKIMPDLSSQDRFFSLEIE